MSVPPSGLGWTDGWPAWIDELEQRAGLSRETVSRIETLKRPAEPATVRALATALEVEPIVLVTPRQRWH